MEAEAPGAPRCVRAPAKINLGLRILGRRDDGYHALESVFLPLDLADELTLTIAAGDDLSLRVIDPQDGRAGASPAAGKASGGAVTGANATPGIVPADSSNLAWRAAASFLRSARLTAAIHIDLVKRIPAAAGMGGGSSDAGAVLRALAAHWPAALSASELRDLAVGLGADVPYFLDPRPALVTGIGERVDPVREMPSLALVLANPRIEVATADVFRRLDASAAAGEISIAGDLARDLAPLLGALGGPGSPGEIVSPPPSAVPLLAALCRNDLEASATVICPEIREWRDRLAAAGALTSGLSGSGATVFGLFESARAAQEACDALSARESGWVRVAFSVGAR